MSKTELASKFHTTLEEKYLYQKLILSLKEMNCLLIENQMEKVLKAHTQKSQ